MYLWTLYGDTVTRYKILQNILYYAQSSLKLRIFQKSNYQITEMEQQILKTINHIKYVSEKGVTISGIQSSREKNLPRASLGEIICKMQQNDKTDCKILNPIYEDKNFAEDPLEIHPKTCNDKSYIPEESVDTALINSNYDNYSGNDKSFTGEHVNSRKTALMLTYQN